MWRDLHRTMFPVSCFPCRFSHLYCSLHASCFAHWAFLSFEHSPSVTLSDSNLSALFNSFTAPFPSWASLEMLWLVFFKLWEKAASLRTPGYCFSCYPKRSRRSSCLLPLCSPGARSPPRGQTLSGARDSLSSFFYLIALCLYITGFIECKENVAVAWGSLRWFNSC